jgi:PAS domain S-box-containing protein
VPGRIAERVIWVGAAAILAIGIAGAITYSRVQLLSEGTGWAIRTEHVRFVLQGTLSTLQDAESATRGFVITHEEVFLDPLNDALPRLDSNLASLKSLVADSPEESARARNLDQLTHGRLAKLEDTVRSVRAGTFVLPKDPGASESKKLMDASRALIAEMQHDEDARLNARLALVDMERRTALIAAVSMSAIAIALLFALGLVGRQAALSVRRSQEGLEAGEERLRLAMEGAGLGAIDHNFRAGTRIWNYRLYEILGYEPGAQVTPEMLNQRIAAEDNEQVQRALQHAKLEHVPFRYEHRIIRANDQAVRWLAARGNFLYDDKGEAVRYIGVVQDITETRRLEQQVRQSQKFDALGTLAGGIAHDFNNILAVLRGNLAMIRGELQTDHPIMPAVADMAVACNRAAALVRQILTFGSRQDQDRRVLQLEGVVAEAIRLLRSTLPAEIEIRSQYARNLAPVLVDPNQVHQIIANLGINSAQAIGRRAGLIELQLDDIEIDKDTAANSSDLKAGSYVRLRFADNGSGIPREVMDRIFEPFFTTRGSNEGTGLGLSIVRGILKNHDAAINVYSEPGRGTRFDVYFPAAQGRPLIAPETRERASRGHGERILYLDDEESLVLLAKRMLERMGYRVAGFHDASQALEAFESSPDDFDLVLTDLSMPGMSGMDVSRRILTIRPDIPVLLATGYVRKEDVDLARSIGIREVIWKPQTVVEMSELLAQQLEKLVPADAAK